MCAYEFFGDDHLVFATDMPSDDELGDRLDHETIRVVEAMAIDERSRRQILSGNLFRLPLA
jgi:predicted TIM-barrel fold metal-dependent hydrolase